MGDQAKSFEAREFTQELTQPSNLVRVFLFSSISAILEGFAEQLPLNAIE